MSDIVAWAEKDGDDWLIHDAKSDLGEHIARYQKDHHYKTLFPVYASPPSKPAPADALALLKRWVEWSCGQQGPSPFHDTRAFLSTTPEQR